MSKVVSLELPFPPSVNRLWRSYVDIKPTYKKGRYATLMARAWKIGQLVTRTVLSTEGKIFYEETKWAIMKQARAQGVFKPFSGRIAIVMSLHRKDQRKYDIDNNQKAMLDALGADKGGLIEDDKQIDVILNVRGKVDKPGYVRLWVWEIGEQPAMPDLLQGLLQQTGVCCANDTQGESQTKGD